MLVKHIFGLKVQGGFARHAAQENRPDNEAVKKKALFRHIFTAMREMTSLLWTFAQVAVLSSAIKRKKEKKKTDNVDINSDPRVQSWKVYSDYDQTHASAMEFVYTFNISLEESADSVVPSELSWVNFTLEKEKGYVCLGERNEYTTIFFFL